MQFKHAQYLNISPFPAWTKTALSTNQPDPFCCTPTWQLTFHDAFSPQRRLFIEQSSQGVMAFAEHRPSPELIFLTPIEPHWFFGCPLLGKYAVDMLSHALSFLADMYKPHFPTLCISGIRPQGTLARTLKINLGKDFDFVLHSTGVQCTASLAGCADGYTTSRSPHCVSTLKKALRQARAPSVTFPPVYPIISTQLPASLSLLPPWLAVGSRCFEINVSQRLKISVEH